MPELGKFPASYSAEVLEKIKEMVPPFHAAILDPFAGPNGIRRLIYTLGPKYDYMGLEIEPEWAEAGIRTFQGDVLDLKTNPEVEHFNPDLIITSPPYGNRMADQYMGDARNSKRFTYAIALGRKLSKNSVARLQWGPEYRAWMTQAYFQIYDTLPSDGRFILNIGNHYRNFVLQPVVGWSVNTCAETGFILERWGEVTAKKIPFGENGDSRDKIEHVFLMRKP